MMAVGKSPKLCSLRKCAVRTKLQNTGRINLNRAKGHILSESCVSKIGSAVFNGGASVRMKQGFRIKNLRPAPACCATNLLALRVKN